MNHGSHLTLLRPSGPDSVVISACSRLRGEEEDIRLRLEREKPISTPARICTIRLMLTSQQLVGRLVNL